MRWKFRFKFFFDLFMRFQVRKILALTGHEIDIVWDFEPNRQFSNLDWFKAPIKIYHPVDITSRMTEDTKNANVIFSVSQVILSCFKNSLIPKYFINHGIGAPFQNIALERLNSINSINKNSEGIKFGYVGNLLMEYINHDLFESIIIENPDIEFHIWGPFDYSRIKFTPTIESRIKSFINFLNNQSNVIMYGMKHHSDILPLMKNMDGFFWCYDHVRDPNKGSNSHKILEYCSIGKVIVSTLVSTYKNLTDQDIIVSADSDKEFRDLFSRVISNMQYYNSSKLVEARIKLALQNTYQIHLNYIDSILEKIH